MIVFKVFGGRGTVGVRGMTVFEFFGGRGTVGVRGMTAFKVFGGRGKVGVRGMTVFNRLGGRGSVVVPTSAATGFAGISTDAALPLSKVASVLSRVFSIYGQSRCF